VPRPDAPLARRPERCCAAAAILVAAAPGRRSAMSAVVTRRGRLQQQSSAYIAWVHAEPTGPAAAGHYSYSHVNVFRGVPGAAPVPAVRAAARQHTPMPPRQAGKRDRFSRGESASVEASASSGSRRPGSTPHRASHPDVHRWRRASPCGRSCACCRSSPSSR
jgi:hypothetical protein